MSHYSNFFSLWFGIIDLHIDPNPLQTLEPPLESCFTVNSLSSGYVLFLSTGFCHFYSISSHLLKIYLHFVQIILKFLLTLKCLHLFTVLQLSADVMSVFSVHSAKPLLEFGVSGRSIRFPICMGNKSFIPCQFSQGLIIFQLILKFFLKKKSWLS